MRMCLGFVFFAFLFFLQVDHKASLPLSYICLDKTVTLRGEKLLMALSSSFYKKTACYSIMMHPHKKINLLSQTITLRSCKGPNTTDILTEIFM